MDELIFEEFPEAALKAYYDLMIEKYGFSMEYPDMELTKSNYLSYGETDNYNIWILLFRNPDGLICINFIIPKYCREEPLETWEGEIDSYLYNPDHWVECSSCEGTGDCPDCWNGYIKK